MVRRERGSITELRKALAEVSNTECKVGFPKAAHYSTGESVAMVAAQQEFGNAARRIPPRSFMRTTVAEKKNQIQQNMESGAKAALNGKLTIIQVFDQIGLYVAGEIKRKITEINSPALSQRTIQARQAKYASNQHLVGGLTKPLVESGLMLATVSHEVTQK